MTEEKKCVLAIDIGIHHFAWVKTVKMEERCRVKGLDCHNFGATPTLTTLYPKLISYLMTVDYADVSTVLIEQQMNRMNIRATKIAVFVHAFFLLRVPHVRVIEYPAYHKTRKFGVPKMTKQQRKKWSIAYVCTNILFDDPVAMDWVRTFPKQDDICDCIMMTMAYFQSPSNKNTTQS